MTHKNLIPLFTILALLTLTTNSVKIKVSSLSLIPPSIRQATNNNNTEGYMSSMFIYPYRIYHYKTEREQSYYFIKIKYEELQPFLSINQTIIEETEEDDQKLLYSLLPEVIILTGDSNQPIQLELLQATLTNKVIIVKTPTDEKQINLTFFSLEINDFILKVIQTARCQNQAQERVNYISSETIEEFQIQSDHLSNLPKIRENLLTINLTKKQQLIYYLFRSFYSSQITSTTKWKALSYGFDTTFVSIQLNKQSKTLKITHLIWQGKKQTRNITIFQPLSYFNINPIQIYICSFRQHSRVLLIDPSRIYLIDIKDKNWHLLTVKKNISLDNRHFFFKSQCQVLELKQEEVISQLEQPSENQQNATVITNITKQSVVLKNFYSSRIINYPMPTNNNKVAFFQSLNYSCFLFCQVNSTCSIFNSQTFVKMTELTFFPTNIQHKHHASLRTTIVGDNLLQYLEITDLATNQSYYQELTTQPLQVNSSLTHVLPKIVYPLPIYLDIQRFPGAQMDQIVFDHFTSTNHIPQHYQNQLSQQIFMLSNTSDNCYTQRQRTTSQSLYQLNGQLPWKACSFQIQPSTLYTLRFAFVNPRIIGYNVYLCQSTVEDQKTPEIDCQEVALKNQMTFEEVIKPLTKYYFYKVYVVRQNQNNLPFLPRIYVKDIEKQQLQIASTVFFFIMVSLALFLVTIILVIILRNVIASLLIYYGYVQPRVEASYPLAWFPFKIKIKRLRQLGVLSYVPYHQNQQTETDQGNQCCFCLEFLKPGSTIAQLYCSHEFHKDCFNEWIRNQPNTRCPTCRREFTRSAVEEYRNGPGSSQELPL